MIRARKKILFLAEGITMAHFTRPAVLAESLDPDEWEIHFRTPQRFHALLRPAVASLGNLRTLSPETFLDLLAHGSVLYKADTIRQYVEDELAIFKEVEPDLVIGDFRLSLSISAPLARLPYASIFNAYWSPYRKQPAIVPELPITRWVSPRLLNPVYAVIRPLLFAYHASPLNQVRRAYGLPGLSHDIRRFYTTGDLVLYPDVPDMLPLERAPAHHHFIGPCLWSTESPKPAWWDEAMASPGPKVFVALGSSGPAKALPSILEALSQLSITAIVATSGRLDMPGKATSGLSNAYVAEFLPFEETASHCAAVISHGGSSGVYPALSAGTPVLALPANIDTHLSAAALNESGAGLSVRVEHASPHNLRSALRQLLSDSRFKESAGKWAGTIARYDTGRIFPGVLRAWFAR